MWNRAKRICRRCMLLPSPRAVKTSLAGLGAVLLSSLALSCASDDYLRLYHSQAVAPGWRDALQATFTSLQARVEQGREMMFEERERLVQLMDIVGTELHRLPPLADHN